MQILISQIAAPVQAAGSKGAPAPAGSMKGFNQLLVQSVAGGKAEASINGAEPALTPVLSSLVSKELASLFSGDTKEGVDQKLTDLIKLLQDGDAQAGEGQNADDLQAMLDQMDKLLASILNIPAAALAANPSLTQDMSTAQSTDGAVALTVVKKELQDVLTQLQTIHQQSASSGMTKEQLSVVSKQLDTLRQIVEGKPVKPPETQTMPVAQTEASSAEQVQQAVVSAGVNAHLSKMSHKSIHAKLVLAVPADTTKEPEPVEAPAVSVKPQLLQKSESSIADPKAAVETEVPQEQPQNIQQMLMSALGSAPVTFKQADSAQTVQLPVQVQQFTEAMTGMIVKQFGITKADGMSEARISLLPEHLGQVDIRISVQNGHLTAHFVTDSAAAKDALENQLAMLRSSLQSQGLQVDKLEVTQNQIQGQMFQEDRRQRSGSQQQSKQGGSNKESLSDVLQGFEMELVEQNAAGDLGYGRGINITA